MKKRELDDHRPQARGLEHKQVTEDEATELANTYGFKPGFNLRAKLDYAFSSEDSVRCITEDSPALSEQRKHLEALRNRCEALEEVISKLGIPELRLLLDAGADRSLSRLEEDIRRIHLATRVSLVKIRDHKDKRPRQEDIWNFVSHLADIWKEGTNTEPTAGYSDINGCYVGDFYHFACECAELGNITLSSGDPGALIVKILSERRQRK
jgi:hypothetical protein